VEVDYAPGEGSKAHRHPGLTFAYVLDGEITSKLDDEAEKTYATGEMWMETPGQLHSVSRNASPVKPAKLRPLMPDGKNYSRINQGRKELIDHILVSAALVKPLDSISAEAIIPEPLASISTDPNARRAQPSSDHAPVVAIFANL
jgi:Cupin domain